MSKITKRLVLGILGLAIIAASVIFVVLLTTHSDSGINVGMTQKEVAAVLGPCLTYAVDLPPYQRTSHALYLRKPRLWSGTKILAVEYSLEGSNPVVTASNVYLEGEDQRNLWARIRDEYHYQMLRLGW